MSDRFAYTFPFLNSGDGSQPIVTVSFYQEFGDVFEIECTFVRCEYALAFVNELYQRIVCWSPTNHYALLDLMARLEADGQAYFPPPFIYLKPAGKGVDTP